MRNAMIMVVLMMLASVLVIGARQQEGATATSAQPDASLFGKIERSLKVKEPRWNPGYKKTVKLHKDEPLYQAWQFGKEYVEVRTYERSSVDEAIALFQRMRDPQTSVSLGRTKLSNLGDEAYLFTDDSSRGRGYAHLLFRKGNVVITLDSRSREAMKRFAHHIAEQIDSK